MERLGAYTDGRQGGHEHDVTEDHPRAQPNDRLLGAFPRDGHHHHRGRARRGDITNGVPRYSSRRQWVVLTATHRHLNI